MINIGQPCKNKVRLSNIGAQSLENELFTWYLMTSPCK